MLSGVRESAFRPARLIICALFALPIPANGAALPRADDEWPRYGHDAALTGRTALKGDIASPRVAWTLSLAGTSIDLEVRPAGGSNALALPGDAAAPLAARTVPVPAQPLRDVD